jgi:hypothetical protein
MWAKAIVVWAWPGQGVKRAKRTQFGAGGPAIADLGLRIEGCRPRAGAGGKMRKTKPIGPGWRVNAQNEANWARPEGKCAKRTQFGRATGARCRAGPARSGIACRGNPRSGRGQALRSVQNEANFAPAGGRPAPNRAKRTQFGSAAGGPRRQNAQNEPNFPRPEAVDGRNSAKRTQLGPAAGGRRRVNARNEPNWARPRAGAGG